MRRAVWLGAVMWLSLAATAAAEPQLARDYTAVTPPQPTSDPKRIVVTELFSYACPHCASLYPSLSKWTASLRSDVLFERVAVYFGRPRWEKPSRLYYALTALGKLAALGSAIFDATRAERAKAQ